MNQPDVKTSSGKQASLAVLLKPRAITVIGALDAPGNAGAAAIASLLKFGFSGPVWPVSATAGKVGGLTAYPNLAALPGKADIALLAVKPEALAEAVRACAKAGIQAGIAFSEANGASGQLQADLAKACGETGFRLCGPNSAGNVSSEGSFAATSLPGLATIDKLIPGGVSLVTQTGDMGLSLLLAAQEIGLGYRHVISTGNEAVVTAADIIAELAEDPKTKVIAAYLETLRNGPALVAAIERARVNGKPVVILKADQPAASDADSPLGVSADLVAQSIFDAHGVVTVDSHRELMDIALYLDTVDLASLPEGNNVVLIVGGGGGGVIASDLCARYGLQVPSLTPATLERLAVLLPPIASTANPIDVTPEMWTQKWFPNFPEILDTIAADTGIDAVVVPSVFLARGAGQMGELLRDFRLRTKKTVLISWNMVTKDGLAAFAAQGIYTFPEVARGIRSLSKIIRLKASLAQKSRAAKTPAAATPADLFAAGTFDRILATAGFELAGRRHAANEKDALEAAASLGYPIIMKAVLRDSRPASGFNLVASDLCNEQEVREGYGRLISAAKAKGIAIDGIVLRRGTAAQPQLRVVAFRDPVFGVIVGCGVGANFADVIDDFALKQAPFDDSAALELLQRLNVTRYTLKMDKAASIPGLAQVVAHFSQLVAGAPWKRFTLEIDPIEVGAGAPRALDGNLFIGE